MTERKAVESWLTDMDGVLVHEGEPVPGAPEFVNRMKASGKPFLILTNNSIYTPRDLQARLGRMGFEVPRSPSGRRRWPPRSFSPISARAVPRT
jgi:NagD protein